MAEDLHEAPAGAFVWKDLHTGVIRRYKASRFDRHFRFSIPAAIALFIASMVANGYAMQYATDKASNSVTDIILSNIPVFDVDWLFVYGAIGFVVLIVILSLFYPKRIPFTLHAMSVLFLTRAVFVSLTHLGLYPTHATLDFQSKIILAIFGGGDEFFSAHTAIPFLMALIYWHEKPFRYFFIAASLFFGVIVLLGHWHYSIDVLAAFFITYGVYHMALWLFPKERALFLEDEMAHGVPLT